MNADRTNACPDCDSSMQRREFIKVLGGTAAVAGVLPLLPAARSLQAAPTAKSSAETAAQRLYESLSESQRKVICMPFDHPLRRRISANWDITEPSIDDDFYSDAQRKTIDEIFRGVTSADGYDRFQKQMEFDDGGFGAYHVALFGEPGSGKFEFEMTGRHMTMRADGDSVENVAFGGPVVYGHGEEDAKQNLFHYQTKKANEVFQALDPKQRERALIAKAPSETDVLLQGKGGKFSGITVGELSGDQKELVESVVKVILAPYRTEDVDEALAVLKSGGGLDQLSMAFYEAGDLGGDQVWDIWRVEGPTFVWHFRGAPHVHAYVNIGIKPKA